MTNDDVMSDEEFFDEVALLVGYDSDVHQVLAFITALEPPPPGPLVLDE